MKKELLKQLAMAHNVKVKDIVEVSEKNPGLGVNPSEYKHLVYWEPTDSHFYAKIGRHASMYHQIIKQFEQNLELSKEEKPELDLNAHIRIAEEWTIDDLAGFVGRIAENRKAGHQDAVNKNFYC
jgi:hypothetical protein